MDIIGRLKEVFEKEVSDDRYVRKDKDEVIQAFQRLDVQVPELFEEFFLNFIGPFWSEIIGMEFFDIVDDIYNIESETNVCREVHSFPKQYLVLTQIIAMEILVLNTLNDKVYRVDFEGGDEALRNGQLEATWESFEEFLIEYFGL